MNLTYTYLMFHEIFNFSSKTFVFQKCENLSLQFMLPTKRFLPPLKTFCFENLYSFKNMYVIHKPIH